MNEKKQTNYPKGHFPVSISVEDRNTYGNASILLEKFIQQAEEKYPLVIVKQSQGDASHAQAVVSIPFPDREHIRIDFNIFASEAENEYGQGLYFHMESAF